MGLFLFFLEFFIFMAGDSWILFIVLGYFLRRCVKEVKISGLLIADFFIELLKIGLDSLRKKKEY